MEGEITNFTFVMSILLTIFGLNSIVCSKDRDIKYSYFKFGYAICLTTILCFCFYYQCKVYFSYRLDSGFLHGIIFFYPLAANTIITILLILSSLYENRIFVEFINKQDADCILKNLPAILHIKPILLLAVIFTFVGPYFLDIFIHHKIIDSGDVLFQALSYIFVVYNVICIGHFSIRLNLVKEIYEEINKEVDDLTRRYDDFNNSSAWKPVAGCGFLEKISTNDITETPERIHQLYELRKRHHLTFTFCRVLDWMYGFSNGVLVAHHAVIGVIHSYWGLRLILAKDRFYEISEMVYVFRSAIWSFLSIIWLVSATTAVTTQGEKTRHLIQKGLIAVKDDNFASQMKTFLLQLTLENITFSPLGFFDLTNDLLLSLLGAIVSYLVILLQYQIMLDEQATST